MEENTVSKSTCRAYSRVGFSLLALLAGALLGSILIEAVMLVMVTLCGEQIRGSWWMWLVTFLPMYAIAFPIGILVLRKLPADQPEKNALTLRQFMKLLCVCFCVMYAGNYLGQFLSALLSKGTAVNQLDSYAMDQSIWKVVVMSVMAPVFEELLCRKLLLDRVRVYGEKLAVLMSGLLFGLLHTNMFQFFYAFGLGCIFAYIYLRTGKLRYPIVFHGIINFSGSVIAPLLIIFTQWAQKHDTHPLALMGSLAVMAYSLLLLGLAVTGLVLLIRDARRLRWKPASMQLPRKQALLQAFCNPGIFLYILVCTAFTVLALF